MNSTGNVKLRPCTNTEYSISGYSHDCIHSVCRWVSINFHIIYERPIPRHYSVAPVRIHYIKLIEIGFNVNVNYLIRYLASQSLGLTASDAAFLYQFTYENESITALVQCSAKAPPPLPIPQAIHSEYPSKGLLCII
jgi:hypothetical protein